MCMLLCVRCGVRVRLMVTVTVSVGGVAVMSVFWCVRNWLYVCGGD